MSIFAQRFSNVLRKLIFLISWCQHPGFRCSCQHQSIRKINLLVTVLNLYTHQLYQWWLMMKHESFFDFAETWLTYRPGYMKCRTFRISCLGIIEKIRFLVCELKIFAQNPAIWIPFFWKNVYCWNFALL